MMQRSSVKEIWKTMRSMDGLTDRQVNVDDLKYEEDKEEHVISITVRPNDGLYHGGQFRFQIRIGPSFPLKAPAVVCLDDIYHPNINPAPISENGCNVCLSLLDEDWEPTNGLDDVIQGILFLLHNPNLDDPLNSNFDEYEDEAGFKAFVRRLYGASLEENNNNNTATVVDQSVMTSVKEDAGVDSSVTSDTDYFVDVSATSDKVMSVKVPLENLTSEKVTSEQVTSDVLYQGETLIHYISRAVVTLIPIIVFRVFIDI